MLLSVENGVALERVGAKAAIDMFVEAGFTGMDYSFFIEWNNLTITFHYIHIYPPSKYCMSISVTPLYLEFILNQLSFFIQR